MFTHNYTRKGDSVDVLIELIVNHPVAMVATVAIVAVLIFVVLGVVFWLGYRSGSKSARQMIEYLAYLQKDREHRRVIKMQALKPNKRATGHPYVGCVSYSKRKTLKNIAQHRRNRRRN